MSSHDYIIDNGTGAAVRSDLNNALNAIATTNSVSGNPATTYAYQIFHDTAASQGLKQRDGSNANSNGLLLYRPLVRDGIYDPANVTLEMIKFTGVASAVNELNITNAITGSAPILSATGDDTNIGITLTPKGTGSVSVTGDLSVSGSITGNISGGTILFPAGTVSNPSITTTNDTNTGLFFNAADNISIVTNGTNRLTVDSDGDIGIGTTTPAVPLHVVRETATTNAVTQALRIDSQSSGTPANGIGVGIQFATETTAANTEIGATIEAITTDITAASEDFDLSFKLMAAGAAAAEQARITSTGLLQFNSGYGSVATAFGCRAWVNFNGTGVVAIRASGNVSSITDNSTGNYTVNFTTAMPDANYSASGSATQEVSDTIRAYRGPKFNSYAAGSVLVRTGYYNDNGSDFATDAQMCDIAIFR